METQQKNNKSKTTEHGQLDSDYLGLRKLTDFFLNRSVCFLLNLSIKQDDFYFVCNILNTAQFSYQ